MFHGMIILFAFSYFTQERKNYESQDYGKPSQMNDANFRDI